MWRTLHLTGLDVEPCGRDVHAMVVAEPFEQALPAVFVEVVHAAIKAVRGLSRSLPTWHSPLRAGDSTFSPMRRGCRG